MKEKWKFLIILLSTIAAVFFAAPLIGIAAMYYTGWVMKFFIK